MSDAADRIRKLEEEVRLLIVALGTLARRIREDEAVDSLVRAVRENVPGRNSRCGPRGRSDYTIRMDRIRDALAELDRVRDGAPKRPESL